MASKKKPKAEYLTEKPGEPNWGAFESLVFQPPAPPPPESSSLVRRALGDSGIALLKGAIGVPEAAVGLADLVTGGGAGRMAEAVGFRPKEAKAMLDEYLSPEQQAANREVQQADGFMGKMGAALSNPSVIGQTVLESLPSMAAGGVAARGVLAVAPRLSPVVAGAMGEGAVTAGQSAEQIRQDTPGGTLSPGQSALAAGSGALTGVLGVLGGRVAKSLGIGDIDTMLAQASRATGTQAVAAEEVKKGLVRRVLEGAVSEGVLEELPQSLQEQMAQNLATGKPIEEGLDYAAVLGLLSGGLMGGAAGGIARPGDFATPGDDIRAKGLQPELGPMTRALNAAVETAAQKADAGEPVPAEPGTLPATGEMAKADPGNTGSAAEGAGAPPAGPAIDFEAVLGRMHQAAADEAQSLRQFGPSGNVAAAEVPPATVIGGPEPVATPAPDILNPKGEPFKNQRAAVAARARQADPGSFDIVPVDGGWVVRPTQGFTSDGLQPAGNAQAGAADGSAVPGDSGLVRQPAVGQGSAADAAAPVDGAAPSGDAAGTGPGTTVPTDALTQPINAEAPGTTGAVSLGGPSESSTPEASAPSAQGGKFSTPLAGEDAPQARWTRATTAERFGILAQAGWAATGDKPSKSADRLTRLGWDKLTDSQRTRIGAALQPDSTAAGAKPTGEATGTGATPAPGTRETPPTTAADGDQKARWLKAVADAHRLAGSTGVQIGGMVNGRLNFLGDPNATKQGRSLLASVEEARKAGATDAEISAAAAPAPAAASDQQVPAVSDQLRAYADAIRAGKGTPGMLDQIKADERLNDGEAEKLLALAREYKVPGAKAEPEVTSSSQPLSDTEQQELDGMLGHAGAISFKQLGEREWRAEATGGGLRNIVRVTGSTKDAARRNLLGAVREAREQQSQPAPLREKDRVQDRESGATGRIKRFIDNQTAMVQWDKGGDNSWPTSQLQKEASKAPAPKPTPSANTIVTDDAAERARALLRKKLGQANMGVDPEVLQAGITLAAYHVERGARTFAAYARAMVNDMGDMVKPYLQSWYMAMRADPAYASLREGMDKASAVEDLDIEQVLADSGPTAAAAPAQNDAKEATDGSPAQPEQLPDANPPQAQPDATAGAGDRQPLDAGVAGQGESAAGSERVPAGTEGAGGRGARGAGQRSEQAPGTPRDPAGAGADAGAAADFDLNGEDIGTGGLTRKYRDNIAAIKILKALEAEGRKSTADERKKLARYVGWGALKGVFDHANKQWAKEYAELKELLTEREWQAAAASVRNAHYTSPVVVKGIVSVLQRLGVTRGRFLEPSVGSGNFFGFMPDQLRKAMQLYGIELDPITSKIAAGLYPSATVKNSGFEDFEIPAEFFDVAAGNPPFGNEPLVDMEGSPYSGWSIHNYFFAKTIDKLRPGGVMSMVVSHNFLDALDGKAREWIAARARLVSAVRLPRTAFKENAGTEVVTDILVFQKTDAGERTPAWLEVGEQTNTTEAGDQVKHRVNRYFLDNPQNVLGKPSAAGSMYRADEYTVEPSGDLDKQLAAWVDTLPEGLYQPIDRTEKMVAESIPDGVKVGSFFVAEDGSIKVRGSDVMGDKTANAYTAPNDKAAARIKGMVGLRDALRSQMRLERSTTSTEAEIEAGRAKLNDLYDKFQKSYGFLNDATNRRLFVDDTEAPLLFGALEFDYDKGVSDSVAEREGIEPRKPSATKADIFKRRVLFPPQDNVQVASARDALLNSLNFKGTVDLGYMAKAYGKSPEAIVAELGDLVFTEPDGGVVTADEYLSGDVKTKLADAEAAARTDPKMVRNVEALRKVIPADKKPSEIHAVPGAKFVPADILEAFAKRISGDTVKAGYVKSLGQWLIHPAGGGDPVLNRATWGTAQLSALEILSSTIAGKTVIVTKTTRNPDGSTTTVVMEKETEAARAKQEAIKNEWQTWLWGDPERAERLVKIYNDEMNRWVDRKYDGSHLTLPGKVPDDVLNLLEHQRNGVWRALQSRQILLDHVVGAGKTFQMVAIAMELRRMGIARKPMLAVPNHLTLQWRSEFARLYPGANVLAATPEDFAKGNREKFFSKIITGDWDAVIVGHSSLKKIALPPDTEKAILEEQVQELSDAIEEMKRARGDKRIVADMQGIKKRLEGKMKEKLSALGNRDKVVTFDELGVDAMFVDELHEFKNLYYNSTMDRVPGMGNPAGSDKGFDLFVKLQWLFGVLGKQAPIVGATGTPVSNSLVEMFNMQRFMQYPTLKQEGLHVFDAWARQFGSVENLYEVAPSGTGYRSSNRFAKFKNLGALMAHYNGFADVVTLDDLKAQEERQGKRFPVPKIRGGRPQIVVADRSPLVADFMGVPRLEMADDGRVVFGFNPGAGEAVDIIEEKDQFKIERVVPASDGKEVRLLLGTTKTRAEAELKVVEAALSPKITVDPKSILGQFGNLKELMRQTKGKVNALSLTGAANKAGLDYRLIDPAAPDFPGSKINLAVDNMMAEYKRWAADKGTQLVFCDLSVPLSQRSGFASKARRLYVREDGAVVHKKGTMHTVEGHEDLPFFIVQRGAKDTKAFDVYDAASGLLVKGGSATKADALQFATDAINDEAKRQRWIDARESTGEITQDLVDEYNDANEIDTEETEAITLQDIAGVSGATKFSVYDDIKAKLIRKGVPEREIAFIHDYGTPTAKDKLFKAVKRGDIRFLLGSTPKMGAGTNVQDLLVALHHIDAPWRPSDLEQREGRIIRRNNRLYERDPDNFEVAIFRYATKQTYDTRRWQILEHKARGIEQLRNYDGTTNEIDDIDGEAANSADMKAAASGDPLILRETQLRNDVKRLETLAAGHVDAVQDMLRRAKSSEDWVAKSAPAERAALDERMSTLNQHPVPEEGMPGGSAVDGKAFTDKKEYTQALARKVAEAVTDQTSFMFSYRGLRFKFHTDSASSTLTPEGDLWSIAGWGKTEAISATGILQRLQNYAERQPGLVKELEARIKREIEQAKGMREQAAKPFPDAALLEKTREQHKKVQRLLIARGPEVPAEEKPILESAQEQQKEALREAGYGDALDELLAFKGATEESMDEEPAPARENIAQTGAAAANDTDVVFKRGAGGGLSLEAAQKMADQLKAMGVVRMNVVGRVADLPPRARLQVLARDPEGQARGAYFRRGDQIYLVAENLRGADEFLFVALHEAFHRGIARTVPNSLALLRQLRIQNQALRAATAEQMRRYGIGMDEAIEEALADMAGAGKIQELKGFERFMALLREWARKLGAALGLGTKTLSDSDLLAFVQNVARDGLTGGVGVETGGVAPAPADAGPMLSRGGMPDLDTMRSAFTARNVADRWNDLTRSSKVFNWWHHTVATQYHKAKVNPLFGAVYDRAQEYLHDTAAFANDPADLAPDVLPQLKTLADMKRSLALKKDDAEKLSAAVFGGTLSWTRDDSGQVREAGDGDTAGVVFTPDELREHFDFNDEQVQLYQQFRRATNRSLDILAAADVARLLGDGLPESMRAMISAGDIGRFRGIVSTFTAQMVDKAEKDLAAVRKRHRNEMAAFWRKQKGLLEGPRGRAGSRLALQEELEAEKNALKFRHGGEKYRAEQEAKKWTELEQTVRGKYERIDELKAQGYAPLMRFGRYTVDVTGADGARQFFGMFETEREANAAARKFRDAAEEGDVVTQGIMSEEAYKQFSGLTPETIELFAEVAGVEKTSLFQEYLRRAKNNRSALKRLIKRTGVAGFSADTPRVLASFVTSNARAASASLHMGKLTAAVEEIPKEQGDVKDEAIKLREYIQNPQEEAQGIRSLLFAQYLGGSVASALVNMTQPFMMTFPYLSQFGGPVAAARRLGAALKTAAAGVIDGSPLAKALRLAEKEGIVEPQELHQLQAEASRTVANNQYARRALFLWGSFFSLAERFNRRVSFIAAYETAVATGVADPFKFAAEAVAETQGIYNKGNRPNWARGAVGATVFTFKQYSISYMEFLKRLPKREKVIALAILVMAAGAQGLPGADDLDDLIDTLGQHLGYDTNAKLWKQRVLEDALGEGGAEFVLRGTSAMPGFPLDVSGRLSLGNLIPGTGLLRKDKTDKAGEVTEALGPFASTLTSAFKSIPALLSGDLAKVNDLMGPTATKNLAKGISMWLTGEYRDGAGRKVTDVTKGDAVVKAIGFQPAEVARDSRAASMAQQQIALARNVESEIASAWAQGIAEGDQDMVQKAIKRMQDWNKANPASRIGINRAQIQKRVREIRSTRDERITKRAPKEMRATTAGIVS